MPRKRLIQKYRWYIAGTLLLIGIIAAISFMLVPRQPSADIRIARATAQLYGATNEFEKTLGTGSTADKVSSQNLYLDAITTQCKTIQDAAAILAKNKADAAASLDNLHDTSNSICTELLQLTKDNHAIYGPIEPVLTISPSSKRYQTLPLIRQLTKSSHLQKIQAAATAYKTNKPSNGDFTSASLATLPALQSAVQQSKQLGYLPQLSQFQLRVTTEWQVYWKSYAGLADLVDLLASQTDGYCTNLPSAKIAQPVCINAYQRNK